MDQADAFKEQFELALHDGIGEAEWLGPDRAKWMAHSQAWTKLAWLVVSGNDKAGLTRIIEPGEMAVKHFLDSLAPTLFGEWAPEAAVVDVGSGAGFPGVVLAIAFPEIQLTLVEASRRRVAFLAEACETLDVAATVLHVRAEDLGKAVGGTGRERFDIGFARAAAPLAVSCELVLPLIRPGGQYLAQTGPADGSALAARRTSSEGSAKQRGPWTVLGAELTGLERADLPREQGIRYVAQFTKTGVTPPQYPRRAGIPERNPLPGFGA